MSMAIGIWAWLKLIRASGMSSGCLNCSNSSLSSSGLSTWPRANSKQPPSTAMTTSPRQSSDSFFSTSEITTAIGVSLMISTPAKIEGSPWKNSNKQCHCCNLMASQFPMQRKYSLRSIPTRAVTFYLTSFAIGSSNIISHSIWPKRTTEQWSISQNMSIW